MKNRPRNHNMYFIPFHRNLTHEVVYIEVDGHLQWCRRYSILKFVQKSNQHHSRLIQQQTVNNIDTKTCCHDNPCPASIHIRGQTHFDTRISNVRFLSRMVPYIIIWNTATANKDDNNTQQVMRTDHKNPVHVNLSSKSCIYWK